MDAASYHNIHYQSRSERTECQVSQLAVRLAAKTVKAPNGCWNFQACPSNPAGHRQLCLAGIRGYAHRIAWELANKRAVPDGMRICHSCDNPACVNPEHLFLGTQAENIHDSIRKGRYNTFGLQKLNAEQVREIRSLWAAGRTQKEIGRAFGIARNTVSGIVNRKCWAHLDPSPSGLARHASGPRAAVSSQAITPTLSQPQEFRP